MTLSIKTLIFYLLLIIISGIGTYGFFVEPYQIDIHELKMKDGILGEGLKGRTAIQISDLHISRIGPREKEVVRIIEDIKPDFIFLTGDYVGWNGDNEPALDFLSRVKAKFGVWAVMGDYDYSRSRNSCLFCHEQGSGGPTKRHDVRFLRNSSDMVRLAGEGIQVYGVDNTDSEDDGETRIKMETPGIILSHNPLEFDMVDKDSEVLMLAGDTHGGQIPLPGWLWRIIGYEKNAKYNHGFYREGKKMMYVSKGIGTSHIPFRLFRRPEVVVMYF